MTPIDVGATISAAGSPPSAAPDVVFNALHGRFGEDGRVQGVLDLLGIPYTHSGVLASALAMDKPMAKPVFAAAGLRCPEGMVVELARPRSRTTPLPPPCVVKPATEGSSVGVTSCAAAPTSCRSPVATTSALRQRVLVERFIPGRELTVRRASAASRSRVTEIRPREGFYDYRAKYTAGFADHHHPGPVTPTLYQRVMEQALAAHRALGLPRRQPGGLPLRP